MSVRVVPEAVMVHLLEIEAWPFAGVALLAPMMDRGELPLETVQRVLGILIEGHRVVMFFHELHRLERGVRVLRHVTAALRAGKEAGVMLEPDHDLLVTLLAFLREHRVGILADVPERVEALHLAALRR